MRKFLLISLSVLIVLPAIANAHGPVRPHRPHSRVYLGMGIGTGFYPGYWYGAPYYVGPPYYGPPVYTSPPVVIQQPPVYVEKSQELPSGYWYFCPSSKAYYPYVNDCPEDWQRVSPMPPPPSGAKP